MQEGRRLQDGAINVGFGGGGTTTAPALVREVSADQLRSGAPVANLAAAQPGDLIGWDTGPRNVGADHVAIGSKLLHPKYLIAFDSLQPIIDRACALLPVPEPADEPVD